MSDYELILAFVGFYLIPKCFCFLPIFVMGAHNWYLDRKGILKTIRGSAEPIRPPERTRWYETIVPDGSSEKGLPTGWL